MFILLLSCLLLVSYSFVEALSPISVKGTKLYDDDGTQFFVKGVSYIPLNGDFDPLVDVEQCQIDAALMNKAGINTIYVYTVDSTQDHDACMKAFADKGIYIWLQLGDFPRVSSPTEEPPQWTLSLFAAWSEALDAFAGYDNTLAFGIGQETITENSTSTRIAPALKAAARDLRAFRTARGYRAIPLAYSAADAPALRLLTAQYLTCDNAATSADNAASIDLLGLNIFEPDSCTATAWEALRDDLRDLPLAVPVVVSETGCLPAAAARNFSDVARVLTAGAFREVFSGASVFEWARQETTEFGVVRYGAEGKGEPEKLLPAYTSLSSVFKAAASVTGTPAAQYTPAASRSGAAGLACPTLDEAAGWLVDGAAALPSIEGLQIGTVTVKTTVTAGEGGGRATGGAGQGQGQVGGGDGGDGGGGELSTGAIAGITVGAVIGVLVVATAILVCLRRRRRAVAPEGEGIQVVQHFKRPRSYWYPAGKVELPAQNMAALEMDGSLHSSASTAPVWKFPLQDGRDDSPTVTEVPEKTWQRTTHYELDGNHMPSMGDGAQTGTWRVSPLTPGGKYV
ncbi:Glucanosyltransferase-domain-containing protein [Chaetomium fimeti]|uniref:1,3-beta-glucanosyltransferase n=1 Tax=Chaetomium fimeti TaxID=1854472 RepID=A0AAE0HN05_9PEZI|nr:Glucanosyltransferase-domain-containing protein [Chaetomium fimeti]